MSYQPTYNSYVSTDNSTTTPLSNGAQFTGVWEEVTKFASVFISISADQNGIAYIDFSQDGISVDGTRTIYFNLGEIQLPYQTAAARKFYRVRFLNDSGFAQTSLGIQSIVKANAESINLPLDDMAPRDVEASFTRPSEFKYEVATNLRQGTHAINKFGYNPDIDTGSEELIAPYNGGTPNIMLTADTLDIVSDSTADDSVGTGAQTIFIEGIDADAHAQSETIVMDGTTTVTTINSYLGVNRAFLLSSGSNGSNVGTITITDTGAVAGVQGSIPVGESVTHQCIIHTPAGTNLLLDWLWFNILKLSGGGGAPRVTIKGYSYSRVTETTYEIFRHQIDTDVENTNELTPSQPFVIGGRETLYFAASTDVDNTEVICRFSGILSENASAE
jgi:hypothetical protein